MGQLPVMRGAAACVALLASMQALAAGKGGALHLLPGSYATGVSRDGSVVVLNDAVQYWYWTEATDLVPIGGIAPGYQGAGGSGGISDDGTRIGYTVINPKTGKTEGAVYRIDTAETVRVGNFGASCDLSGTSSWGISGDGQRVVGLGWHSGCEARGYSWTAAGGLVDLGTSFFYESTRANGCDYTGSVIAGWQSTYTGEWQGCVWRNGVQRLIFTATGQRVGEAAAVSGDGVWAVGLGRYTENPAWRWSEGTGHQPLPLSPITGFRAYATDVSDDGSRIAMFFRAGPPATSGEGYLWIDGTLHELEQYARDQGVDVPQDVRLSLPLAISADGYTIVGTGRTAFGVRVFVLDLPRPAPSCPTDIDGNGDTGASDLALLLGAWSAPGGASDLDGDGSVGASDLALLLGAWGACP